MLKPGVAVFDENAEHYDQWFEQHGPIYQAELSALRRLMPDVENAVEIGVGTGRFAAPLGIAVGVEPSANMAKIAEQRGITVTQAYGENLPFPDKTFDLVLLVYGQRAFVVLRGRRRSSTAVIVTPVSNA